PVFRDIGPPGVSFGIGRLSVGRESRTIRAWRDELRELAGIGVIAQCAGPCTTPHFPFAIDTHEAAPLYARHAWRGIENLHLAGKGIDPSQTSLYAGR